jgi:tricarballylate dehydrogenase
MADRSKHLVIVGQGAAGLAAALAAAEAVREQALAVHITLIEKAGEDEAGGNTRWSPSYMRMAAPDRVEPSFVDDMLTATQGKGDRAYFERLAAEAPATAAWIASHGITFHQPVYYLAKGPPRIQPVGGGPEVVRVLSHAAKNAGIDVRYQCIVRSLVCDADGRLCGVIVSSGAAASEALPADAVILASGGFQGNGEMMQQHFGPGAESMKLISPGTRFNTGDGIIMAAGLSAQTSGDWNGMHSEPIDPRSKNSAPVVLVYPYGIVVDRSGRRIFDEGGGLVHETWERFSRDIHFTAPGREVYAVLDSRLFAIADYGRAIRSEVPPVQADTLEALAGKIGVDADNLAQTVAAYNAAATGDAGRFDATLCDGLAAAKSLDPSKSNWARAITEPPFVGYPLIGAIAYTFGGVATNTKAEVLRDGAPIPGLYAAGEMTGHFYAMAPNAVSVLRAFVFGRIAGREAVAFLGKDKA